MDSILSGMPPLIVLIALAVLGLASLIAGIVCLVFYAKTKKTLLLIAGLLLTFGVPGLFCCIVLALWIPNAFVVYAPPPR